MTKQCTVFAGTRLIARGLPAAVAERVKQAVARGEAATILIFDDRDARSLRFDPRLSIEQLAAQLAAVEGADGNPSNASGLGSTAGLAGLAVDPPRGRGRPKLGVVAREVTLLPRHWDWLAMQPGGASVTLRRLVDGAREIENAKERVKAAQETVHRFMLALALELPGYEDALRALYAGERERFDAANAEWPHGVRDYARELAAAAFGDDELAMSPRPADA
ncbi:hypothetical protein C7405_103317 [Paraburkholderia caballeronis]|uniref:DUF2239 family protein n=1 Tax=Paraburkholderia caballeronis TaxID=416943 RepID=UPI0010649EAD|nr:DUF2239 family protein [Paraburkholderia caballeronis]TDV37190.1 hypothetical protein C7405_103317 [Paraburkholderia caballeronis]